MSAAVPFAARHPLFERFPLIGRASTSAGLLPMPYHVYDGHGAFVGGEADLPAVQALLARESLHAVQTTEGRALAGLWVFDFTQASLGAHHELQVSLFVSRAPLPPVAAHPLALLELMVTRPEVLMLCHGLWNSTRAAVAYNRELLALDARESVSRIERSAARLVFDVRERAGGQPVLQGTLARPGRAALGANLALLARLGLRRTLALARQPWIRVPVLNPVGPVLARNAAADSYTATRRSALRYADPECDRLVFGDSRYAALGFQPRFVQTMEGFRFVYGMPA